MVEMVYMVEIVYMVDMVYMVEITWWRWYILRINKPQYCSFILLNVCLILVKLSPCLHSVSHILPELGSSLVSGYDI